MLESNSAPSELATQVQFLLAAHASSEQQRLEAIEVSERNRLEAQAALHASETRNIELVDQLTKLQDGRALEKQRLNVKALFEPDGRQNTDSEDASKDTGFSSLDDSKQQEETSPRRVIPKRKRSGGLPTPKKVSFEERDVDARELSGTLRLEGVQMEKGGLTPSEVEAMIQKALLNPTLANTNKEIEALPTTSRPTDHYPPTRATTTYPDLLPRVDCQYPPYIPQQSYLPQERSQGNVTNNYNYNYSNPSANHSAMSDPQSFNRPYPMNSHDHSEPSTGYNFEQFRTAKTSHNYQPNVYPTQERTQHSQDGYTLRFDSHGKGTYYDVFGRPL